MDYNVSTRCPGISGRRGCQSIGWRRVTFSHFDPRTPRSCHMRRYREPFSVPAGPDIGIAALPLLALCSGVAGASVDDRDISKNAHFDILHREAADRDRSSGLCEELVLVDERPVWVRAQKILGQDLVEPLYIAMLH